MKRITSILIALIALTLLISIGNIINKEKQVESNKVTDHILIIDDYISNDENNILIENNNIYFSVELIKEHFDNNIEISQDGKRAYIDLENKSFEMETKEITDFIKENSRKINIPLKIEDDNQYLPINHMKKLFSIDIKYNESLNTVVIDKFSSKNKFSTILEDDIKLYKNKSTKGKIIDTLDQGSRLMLLSKEDNWYKVRTDKGYFGYVDKKYVNEEIKEMDYDNKINSIRKRHNDENINITWEYVYEKTPDISDEEKIQGLDVLVPTWFSLSDEGDVINKADFNYMKDAHKKGYRVWGLVDNSFDPDLTSKVIGNEEIKNKFISQIAFYAGLYNLDGINIDFENIYYEDKDNLVKFVEDLTYILKKQNLMVSIDVTVPGGSKRWSQVYDRERLANIVDYVALMAYDEHWASSPVSGSVASINWVERGIQRSLEYIPKEKLLLGIPFYTRVWKETKDENGNTKVSSKAIPIKNVEEILKKYDAVVTWDDETGQYFAIYDNDGATYKIWIEDIRSIKIKIQMAKKYDLKGIASWRKGYEYDKVWEAINTVIEDNKDLL